jgi:hypothetical protein
MIKQAKDRKWSRCGVSVQKQSAYTNWAQKLAIFIEILLKNEAAYESGTAGP